MVRTKVFVGNLSFEITESELLAEFSNAGKVISANIITRGPRSLGYGFVEMDSEEDANKAVAAMHKKEIKGRQINVEVAKPQDETKKPQPKAATDGENADGAPQRQRRRRPANKNNGPKSEVTEEGKAPKPRNRRAPAAEGESDEAASAKKTRAPRPKNTGAPKRTPTEPREESKTTLFVANLPFSFNDEEFAKILTDKGLKLKSAHVVSKKNGKSKGYGFVEFDNQEDQQKALAALHKITVDNRELSVKVALTDSKPQEEDKPAAEKSTAAPAEKKTVANEKKTNSPAEKKANPTEKKTNAPAEKKSTPTVDKKTAAPEKKTETAEKKAVPAEKKTTPTAEKKTATPEKK